MPNSTTDKPRGTANPLALEWARKQAVYEPEEIEAQLKYPAGTIEGWEKGVSYPDIDTLRQLSHIYNIPFSYFFLEEFPAEPEIDVYRLGSLGTLTELSRDTKLALREFKRLSYIAKMLQEILGDTTSPKIIKASTDENPERLARKHAQILGVTPENRKKCVSKENAYLMYRNAIEKLNIFVISQSMPSTECRGAALREESLATAILINQSDPPTARSFTLFHEYCHLLQSENNEFLSCDHFPGPDESFSNSFASSILLPEDEFVDVLKQKKLFGYQQTWSDSKLKELSDEFFVSKDVVAIRLESLSLADPGFYRMKREHWDRIYGERPAFGRGGGKTKKVYAQYKLGNNLFNLTLNAVKRGAIHPLYAAIYIGSVRGGKRPWVIKEGDVRSWTA